MQEETIIEAEPVEVTEDLQANEDGLFEEVEVYRDKRTGNVVMNPKIRSLNKDQSRRDKCWDLYIKSWRAGNPSAMAAAKAAGFSPNTAMNITKMAWFKERANKLRRSKMMDNAERNIARILNLGFTKIKKLETGEEVEVLDTDVLKIVADMSKTIATTLGKDLGYSTKSEVKVSALPAPILDVESLPTVENKELESDVR